MCESESEDESVKLAAVTPKSGLQIVEKDNQNRNAHG